MGDMSGGTSARTTEAESCPVAVGISPERDGHRFEATFSARRARRPFHGAPAPRHVMMRKPPNDLWRGLDHPVDTWVRVSATPLQPLAHKMQPLRSLSPSSFNAKASPYADAVHPRVFREFRGCARCMPCLCLSDMASDCNGSELCGRRMLFLLVGLNNACRYSQPRTALYRGFDLCTTADHANVSSAHPMAAHLRSPPPPPASLADVRARLHMSERAEDSWASFYGRRTMGMSAAAASGASVPHHKQQPDGAHRMTARLIASLRHTISQRPPRHTKGQPRDRTEAVS